MALRTLHKIIGREEGLVPADVCPGRKLMALRTLHKITGREEGLVPADAARIPAGTSPSSLSVILC
jgi:hypothetical protein